MMAEEEPTMAQPTLFDEVKHTLVLSDATEEVRDSAIEAFCRNPEKKELLENGTGKSVLNAWLFRRPYRSAW